VTELACQRHVSKTSLSLEDPQLTIHVFSLRVTGPSQAFVPGPASRVKVSYWWSFEKDLEKPTFVDVGIIAMRACIDIALPPFIMTALRMSYPSETFLSIK
jgi:hypothetical protein